MILVDGRTGSVDLYPFIKAITPDVILTQMEFGDAAWWGEGRDGKGVQVGVEYKKLEDVLRCMVDGRFAGHQLPGMLQSYDRVYLLIEMGRTRADRNSGVLQRMRGDRWWDIQRGGRGFTARELEHWITTMEEFAQVRVVRTFDQYDSARWIVSKASWWTAKGWEDHKSLSQFHIPPPPAATFLKPGVVRRVSKELAGIGWDRSKAVEAKFASVREMCNANEQTWATIDGIGATLSKRIVMEITGGKGKGG